MSGLQGDNITHICFIWGQNIANIDLKHTFYSQYNIRLIG